MRGWVVGNASRVLHIHLASVRTLLLAIFQNLFLALLECATNAAVLYKISGALLLWRTCFDVTFCHIENVSKGDKTNRTIHFIILKPVTRLWAFTRTLGCYQDSSTGWNTHPHFLLTVQDSTPLLHRDCFIARALPRYPHRHSPVMLGRADRCYQHETVRLALEFWSQPGIVVKNCLNTFVAILRDVCYFRASVLCSPHHAVKRSFSRLNKNCGRQFSESFSRPNSYLG